MREWRALPMICARDFGFWGAIVGGWLWGQVP